MCTRLCGWPLSSQSNLRDNNCRLVRTISYGHGPPPTTPHGVTPHGFFAVDAMTPGHALHRAAAVAQHAPVVAAPHSPTSGGFPQTPGRSRPVFPRDFPSGVTEEGRYTDWAKQVTDGGKGLISDEARAEIEKLAATAQKEVNSLVRIVDRTRRCIQCHKNFTQKENGPEACTHHIGSVKFYSCTGCGGKKYYSCCNKCDNCSAGCRKTPHASYD
uniref:Uncharacterized protein n=1 Tax=Chromera velia CCMP2878 TaxID=1169474 RepID=A0A0G4I401_9ALVE|eukprot:Cvel_10724.t1-p1 / transcript=Cvel_10724.t1 / gene=Cvel_10724 / organism=Chromera_velia_CCMP2878 / gene_product=hypothetical protein / transcript_product=hypothetical protein / location=Cvel_scaffold653:9852-13229(-) / protein_length=214 / sequence_SO=supercontig / SO=protein_coding / is_pseudo=false